MKILLAASLLFASLSQFNFTGTVAAQTLREWSFAPGDCPGGRYLPEPERSDKALPAYYFPARPASFGQAAFPATVTVARIPCADAPYAEIRLSIKPLPGFTSVIPKIQIFQRGVDYGCAGLRHGNDTGIPGWPGLCQEFYWVYGSGGIVVCQSVGWCTFPEAASSLNTGVTATLASRMRTTSFDPDQAFTLVMSRGGPEPDTQLVYEIPARGTPGNVNNTPASVPGMWWNPAQPGWAMVLDRNERGVLFASWLTYDDAGKSTWFVMTNGTETAPGVISGDAYALRGQPFSQPDSAATMAGEVVGKFSFTFKSGSAGEFRYKVNGRSGTVPIERFVTRTAQGFACRARTPGVLEVSGMPGWAANIEGSQGYDTVCGTHATLMTYDDEGKPMWVYGSLKPNVPRTEDSASNSALYGALYRPSGTPYGLAWDASRFAPGAPVGIWDSSYLHTTNPQPLNKVTVDIGGAKRVLGFKRFTFEY